MGRYTADPRATRILAEEPGMEFSGWGLSPPVHMHQQTGIGQGNMPGRFRRRLLLSKG